MKFKPGMVDDQVNLTPTQPGREAITLTAGILGVLLVLLLLLGFSVELAITLVSPETEARLFEGLSAELVDQTSDYEDQVRIARLQEVMARVAAQWPESPYHFHVGVLPSDRPNALALPGGSILVTSALLEDVISENELAFILGHELGHFRNRDHLRALGRQAVYSLALTALLGSSGASSSLLNTTTNLTSRGFSRAQERQADLFGLGLVAAEYGHIGDSWAFFERLASRDGDTGPLEAYLATHPASDTRIHMLKEEAARRGWALTGPITPFLTEVEDPSEEGAAPALVNHQP